MPTTYMNICFKIHAKVSFDYVNDLQVSTIFQI